MSEIIPAILPRNYEDLKNNIALVRGLVPVAQIDICDGVFVPSTTWPFVAGKNFDFHFKNILNEEEGMPFWEDISFELDLMVSDAVSNFDIYNKIGASRMIFHLEAELMNGKSAESFKNFLEGIDSYTRDNLEIGLAFNPSTPLERVYPFVSVIDFVQFMGNDKLGYHGVELDEKVYENIRIFSKKYSDMPIAIDIGVNSETAPLLVQAGVSRLVAGSAIFNADDIIGRIEEFKNL